MFHLLEKVIFISVLILLVLLGFRMFTLNFSKSKVTWGVSFDSTYAWSLGFDPQVVYRSMFDDLKIDHVRLSARWNKIEKERGVYDWSDLDWQVNIAKEHNAKILMAVGRKLPRWPECYLPDWWFHLTKDEQRLELLKFVETAVERYKGFDNIVAWQVENEPLVDWFGVCPAPSKEELRAEIDLVKKLDSRPTVVTDSGELSTWVKAARFPDILGTTMYRVVNNKWLGYFYWPLPPAYYYYKAEIVKKITGVKKVIVSELQAEPWAEASAVQDLPLTEQYKSMDIKQFKSNVSYAKRAGFDTVYLWGVEWWYWMKEKQGVPDYWQEAGKLWQ